MAKKRNKNHNKTYKTRVNPIHARDPLRSFLGLDVPTSRYVVSSSPSYSPSKPKAGKGQLLYSPSNPPTPTTKPVNLYQATAPSHNVIRAVQTVCSRRQARKEVMHAFNHAGKAGQKKPVRTPNSNIQCKG